MKLVLFWECKSGEHHVCPGELHTRAGPFQCECRCHNRPVPEPPAPVVGYVELRR